MSKPIPPYTLRAATEVDKPLILPLLAELAPHLDAERRWAWLYEGNPEGQAITWVAIDDASGELAGVTSYFPIRLWVEGQVVRGALGGDGFVPPKFRRRGIAAALHGALRAEMPRHRIEVMFGAPAAMNRTPLQQSGSRVIGEMVRCLRPLWLSALWPSAASFEPLTRRIFAGRGVVALEEAGQGDPRIDEVWAATRAELAIATVRDSRFYKWRFGDAPAGVQRPYVVVEEGKPIAICALQERGDRMLIVDLCAPAKAWGAALGAIARHARGKRGLEIEMIREDAQRRQLWKHGYVTREGRSYLALASEETTRAATYYDGARWTYLDADIDVDNFI